MTRTVICRACGWASFAVSTAYAEREVAEFNRFLDRASPETRAFYEGQQASISSYRCLQCNGTTFRLETPEDQIPKYVTLNPVICDELADDPQERPH